jgi:hypothetical protein
VDDRDVLTPAAGDRARDPRARDLTVAELAHRWWRPATVVLVLAAAVAWRLVAPGLGAPPNLEIATAATFLAVLLLRNRWAAVVPFAVVAVSDAVLGNTQIMWFTWSAWAVIGLGAILARHLRGPGRYAAALGVGVGGSLWFFAWTNFGVWLMTGCTRRPWTGSSRATSRACRSCAPCCWATSSWFRSPP